MALSNELINQFAKVMTKGKKESSESTVYGVVVEDGNGNKYVKLDGSDQLTPLSNDERPSVDSTLVGVKEGERVSVLIKDHAATVTGNVSSPAVRTGDFNDLSDQVTDIAEFDTLIANRIQANEAYIKDLQADHVSVGDLEAANAKITELESTKVSTGELTAAKAEITDLVATKIDAGVVSSTYATIENLEAANAKITELESTKVSTGELTAAKAEITELVATKIDADVVSSTYAKIESLSAVDAKIDNLESRHGSFETLTTETFNAHKASMDNLEATKLSATDADIKYANIDFANISMAAVEELFSKSGIIKDLVVGDTSITGELVGVTIKGDVIEGGTVKADKLVVKGSDGLYYKLNTDGVTTEAEQTEYNSLDGSVITAKSITATKVNVDDLVAFDATIGGFHITEESLYSGVKTAVDNTTTGIYLDSGGQMAIGDSNNFLKYYKDQNGIYKLEISANNISISSNGKTTNLSETITDIKNNVSSLDTKIQQNKDAISLRATKTEVLSSKNGNLLLNGYGEYCDNTNYSGEFVRGDCPDGAYGYFKQGGIFSDYIPFNKNVTYDCEYYVRRDPSAAASTRGYFSIMPYDVDKNLIGPQNILLTNKKLYYLSQDLNPGDTVVHFTDLLGWIDYADDNYYRYGRSFLFFGYSDSTGYVYPDGVYSRKVYKYVYSSFSDVNKTDNTITLNKGWTGDAYPAGACLGQSWDGGTYIYIGNTINFDTEWQRQSRIFDAGVSASNFDYCHERLAPAAYFRVGFKAARSPLIHYSRIYIGIHTVDQDARKNLDAAVDDLQTVMRENDKSTIESCNNTLNDALANYVDKTEYNEYRETTESKLDVFSDNISMNFNKTTEMIGSVDDELKSRFNNLSKYIRFSVDGIEIGDETNKLTLVLDNDAIRFDNGASTIGWWDGENFHTGNIIVRTRERAQFGQFAYVPRSDGSLMFLKVGPALGRPMYIDFRNAEFFSYSTTPLGSSDGVIVKRKSYASMTITKTDGIGYVYIDPHFEIPQETDETAWRTYRITYTVTNAYLSCKTSSGQTIIQGNYQTNTNGTYTVDVKGLASLYFNKIYDYAVTSFKVSDVKIEEVG